MHFASNAMMRILSSTVAAMAVALVTAQDGNVCVSDTNVFTARVNLFGGELGESHLSATSSTRSIDPSVVL